MKTNQRYKIHVKNAINVGKVTLTEGQTRTGSRRGVHRQINKQTCSYDKDYFDRKRKIIYKIGQI